MFNNNHEPKAAAIIAGIPKRNTTLISAFWPTKINLNTLLKKCTTPVKPIAMFTGKKIMNTGVKMVPNPNPEKNVSMATINATIQIIKISIMNYRLW